MLTAPRRALALSAAATALAVALGTVFAADPAPKTANAAGQALYEAKCALCHGKDGVPLPMFAQRKAPNFTDAVWQKSKTDAQLHKSIVEGVNGTMMRAFGKELKSAEIDSIVAHVRSLAAAKK